MIRYLHAGQLVWCRVAGTELVITVRTGRVLAEISCHELAAPDSPRICDEHYSQHPVAAVRARLTAKLDIPMVIDANREELGFEI